MKRMLQMVIVLGVLLIAQAPAVAYTYEEAYTQPLIAGGVSGESRHIVGSVNVWHDKDYVYVEYTTTSDWCLAETHLDVAVPLSGIPKRNLGPIPAMFRSDETHNCANSYTHRIENQWPFGTLLFISAHAVVRNLTGYTSDLSNFRYARSMMVDMKPVYYGYNSTNPVHYPSYLEITVYGSLLGGVYDGWCVDTERTIISDKSYTAFVYSSYQRLPEGAVDKPWNFDLVNWIINQGFVGKPSPACPADLGGQFNYTFADVQRAIWVLLDDMPGTSGIGDEGDYWTQCRVNELLNGAYEFGNGFVPGCFQKIAVVFVVGGAQTTIIGVPVSCKPAYGDEVAWGNSKGFWSRNGAKYFIYRVK